MFLYQIFDPWKSAVRFNPDLEPFLILSDHVLSVNRLVELLDLFG